MATKTSVLVPLAESTERAQAGYDEAVVKKAATQAEVDTIATELAALQRKMTAAVSANEEAEAYVQYTARMLNTRTSGLTNTAWAQANAASNKLHGVNCAPYPG